MVVMIDKNSSEGFEAIYLPPTTALAIVGGTSGSARPDVSKYDPTRVMPSF